MKIKFIDNFEFVFGADALTIYVDWISCSSLKVPHQCEIERTSAHSNVK